MIEPPVIHIAFADDHVMFRKGIMACLHDMGGMIVDIDADNGKELIQKIEKAKEIPDVCILDISMPEMNGFDTIIELKKKWPEMGVLILTIHHKELYMIRMILNGANGYLLKKSHPEELKKAIIAIHNDGMYYSDIATQHFFHEVQNKQIKLPHLTAMEIRVIKECCGDLNYGQIGKKIGKTQKSVEGYRNSLFKKTQSQ